MNQNEIVSRPGHLTLAMIKPHAYREGKIGKIISRMEDNGFKILMMKSAQFRREGAKIFYREHAAKDFFEELVSTMCAGPVVPIVLAKHNAVLEFRSFLGNTDSSKADPDTLRFEFGNHKKIMENAVHGSSSDGEAKKEINFFFGRELELASKVDSLENKPSPI